jgi:putative ABC transport system permease protein
MEDRAFVWYAPKDLVVRTAGEPVAIVPALRAIIQRADPDLPLSDVGTVEELVAGETAPRTVQLRVIEAFALAALALGAIGIHGLLAFAVSARTAEIGVRVALGAQRTDIVSMIVRRSLVLTAAGVIAGVALAYMSGRAMQSLLAGVAPADGVTFAVAVGLTLAMAAAGSLRPALSAVRVDPVAAIRQD